MEQPPEIQYKPFYTASHALIIGINSYDDPRFAPLGQAETDAKAISEVLSQHPYNFTVETLLGKAATRQGVLQALYKLRRTGPDDRILIYFAGHGYTLTNRFGGEKGYLAAADTVPEQDFTALELDEITDLRLNAGAKHIAFIFDACFSGQALGLTRASSVVAQKLLTRRAYQVISAGAADQTVSDYHSMTDHLLSALRGAAVEEDGEQLGISRLGLYLQETMARDSGQTQIPQFGHLRGSQGGEFYLESNVETGVFPVASRTPKAVEKAAEVAAATLPPEPVTTPEPTPAAPSRPAQMPRYEKTASGRVTWVGSRVARTLGIPETVLGAIMTVVMIGIVMAVIGLFQGRGERTAAADITPTIANSLAEPTDRPTEQAATDEATDLPDLNNLTVIATETPNDEPPTSTAVPTAGPTPTITPVPPGFPGNPVTSNAQWRVVAETFNGVEMVLVPVGCFLMGSDEGEADEAPVHQICFGKPFWIDRYEVTNQVFGSVGSIDCANISGTTQQPRNCVSWFQAEEHCASREARLPSEAEWEYAASGPDGLIYPWGNKLISSNAVWNTNVTRNVGSASGGVSWVGAYDMSGNLWEWVNTAYSLYPYVSGDGREDNGLENPISERVIRGGSYGDTTSFALRTTDRSVLSPGRVTLNVGFRCARSFE